MTPPPPPLPPTTRPRRNILEFFRSGEGVLTTTVEDDERTTSEGPRVRLTTSAVKSISATLMRRKTDPEISTTANISVREALRTKGEEA